MLKTKTLLATLAVGILFAGPAFAEKMKATLDGKSETPPNTSAATGKADIDYDAATKKLSWKLTYSGLSGPATAAHFHGPAEPGKNAGVAVAIPNAGTSPVDRQRHADRRPGRRPRGRQVLRQHPHRGQSGRRNPRPGDQVSQQAKNFAQSSSTEGASASGARPFFVRPTCFRPATAILRQTAAEKTGKETSHDLSGRQTCSACCAATK